MSLMNWCMVLSPVNLLIFLHSHQTDLIYENCYSLRRFHLSVAAGEQVEDESGELDLTGIDDADLDKVSDYWWLVIALRKSR